MTKKNGRKSEQSSSSTFLTFWTTLPGILTGVAALITAIVGLYLALAPRNHDGTTTSVTSPTPQITAKPDVSVGNCYEQEFAKVDPVEVGSGEQNIASKDGVTRVKLTDKHAVVGALRLRFYRVGDYFKVEQALDSKCQPVEGLRNLSRQQPVDENNKPKNYDELEIQLGGQAYSLRLGFDAFACTVNFRKL